MSSLPSFNGIYTSSNEWASVIKKALQWGEDSLSDSKETIHNVQVNLIVRNIIVNLQTNPFARLKTPFPSLTNLDLNALQSSLLLNRSNIELANAVAEDVSTRHSHRFCVSDSKQHQYSQEHQIHESKLLLTPLSQQLTFVDLTQKEREELEKKTMRVINKFHGYNDWNKFLSNRLLKY
eukprot:m.143756 g.143756  ORF g.143756 m.143756 type:complete len:179 (-) comp13212_c1_seq2:5367-5903(-)